MVRQRSERIDDWHLEEDDDPEEEDMDSALLINELKDLNSKLFQGFAEEISR